MLTLCQVGPGRTLTRAPGSHRRLRRPICTAYALLKIFLRSSLKQAPQEPQEHRPAGAKGKGKHSISFAYALLTHFTVVAAVTRRSEHIAAK